MSEKRGMFNGRIFYGFSLAIRAVHIVLAFCDDDLVFSSVGVEARKLFLSLSHPQKGTNFLPQKNGKFFKNHLRNFPLTGLYAR
jgi:hypothetical protein